MRAPPAGPLHLALLHSMIVLVCYILWNPGDFYCRWGEVRGNNIARERVALSDTRNL